MRTAIIGTAGRGTPVSKKMWLDCRAKVLELLGPGPHELVSGGAAVMDHLAVSLWLSNQDWRLRLFMPAPWDSQNHRFLETKEGKTSNWYHRQFSVSMGNEGQSLETIHELVRTQQDEVPTVHISFHNGFFVRNKLVANYCDQAIALTFGDEVPMDGGTKHTWDQIGPKKRRIHVSLPTLTVYGV